MPLQKPQKVTHQETLLSLHLGYSPPTQHLRAHTRIMLHPQSTVARKHTTQPIIHRRNSPACVLSLPPSLSLLLSLSCADHRIAHARASAHILSLFPSFCVACAVAFSLALSCLHTHPHDHTHTHTHTYTHTHMYIHTLTHA